ncbi:hypothetical protein [Lactobacillus helveticus]|uniref:hypothetical protein n=1 Tax=Lactobacillus helveticus TaxID=1587 RepID=UPI001F1809E0|nr:hypothetical protein [Lactobacillus helveticus]
MSFALLGGTYLVNNQTAQTVQAARRVVNVQTLGACSHYITLANKPGTHYFHNKQLEMINWSVDSPTYNMHGVICMVTSLSIVLRLAALIL